MTVTPPAVSRRCFGEHRDRRFAWHPDASTRTYGSAERLRRPTRRRMAAPLNPGAHHGSPSHYLFCIGAPG
jgi:hypothetical protein